MKSWSINNLIPAVVWVAYHAIVPNWHWDFMGALLFLRATIVLVFFLMRDEPLRRAPRYQIAIAWGSTFLPTLLVWHPSSGVPCLIGEFVAIAGMVFFIFTCLDLGKSFGVSPAVRPYVERGVYGRLPHPMYLSHVVVEIGLLIASPTPVNFAIAGMSWAFYALRAKWETDLHVRYAEVPA